MDRKHGKPQGLDADMSPVKPKRMKIDEAPASAAASAAAGAGAGSEATAVHAAAFAPDPAPASASATKTEPLSEEEIQALKDAEDEIVPHPAEERQLEDLKGCVANLKLDEPSSALPSLIPDAKELPPAAAAVFPIKTRGDEPFVLFAKNETEKVTITLRQALLSQVIAVAVEGDSACREFKTGAKLKTLQTLQRYFQHYNGTFPKLYWKRLKSADFKENWEEDPFAIEFAATEWKTNRSEFYELIEFAFKFNMIHLTQLMVQQLACQVKGMPIEDEEDQVAFAKKIGVAGEKDVEAARQFYREAIDEEAKEEAEKQKRKDDDSDKKRKREDDAASAAAGAAAAAEAPARRPAAAAAASASSFL
jgi:hypothetical protein